MKVRDWLQIAARLKAADPDSSVLVDERNGCLIVLRVRSGMHQPFEDEDADLLRLTEQDRKFLRAMRIEH